MRTVSVETTFPAPIETVFDLITDHANYSQFRVIQHSELLRPGKLEPNGVGALRRVYSRPLRFEEEITAFERPTRMDYLIRRVNAPLRHQGGSMLLERSSDGTRVTWTSTFEFTTPGIGGLLTSAIVPVVSFGFRSILRDVERLLADRSADVGDPRGASAARSPDPEEIAR
jgi:uncharacterized protein YndB with AHSA1/START domain